MKQILKVPTNITKVEMPEGLQNFILPSYLPPNRNFGVFYSQARTEAVVLIEMSTLEVSEIAQKPEVEVYIKESLELEAGNEMKDLNPELNISDDFNLQILDKRLTECL